MNKIKCAIIVVATLIVSSCGGSKSNSATDADLQAIESVVEQGAPAVKSQEIDSLALMADDLTPVEATEVLMAYMAIADNPDTKSKTRLLTMRKFVDVYDIVMAVNGANMRPVFERSAQRWPQYNIMEKAKAYRTELIDYAEGSAVEESAPEQPKTEGNDSTATAAPQPEPVEANAE